MHKDYHKDMLVLMLLIFYLEPSETLDFKHLVAENFEDNSTERVKYSQ